MIWIMIDEYDGIDEQAIGDFIETSKVALAKCQGNI
jgi:hypothetical protein